MSRDDAQSITGKVFDTDSNPVSARLLVWGPEEVDGERCVIVEPTDFFCTAPHDRYEGQERAAIAADDLRIAIPVRLLAEARSDRCPACGSEALCRLTDEDGPADWGCIECGADFDAPGEPVRETASEEVRDGVRRRKTDAYLIEWRCGWETCDDFETALARQRERHDEGHRGVTLRANPTTSEGTAETGSEAHEVSRRAALKGMRFDFLRDHGRQHAAVDYEDGTVTLTELLRRHDTEPEVVFAIAGWLEEDAAESTPL